MEPHSSCRLKPLICSLAFLPHPLRLTYFCLCFLCIFQLGLSRRDLFVHGLTERNAFSVEEAVGVIRQAFSCFDKDGKGFVSATDISRVLAESGEGTLSEEVRVATSSIGGAMF